VALLFKEGAVNFFKQPIFYGLLVLAIIVTFAWTAIANKIKTSKTAKTTTTTQVTTKISNLSNADPSDFDSITQSEFSSANTKAIADRPDNVISAIEVDLTTSLQATDVNTRYVYTAKSDTTNNWMITISAASGNFIRATIPKADYLGNLTAINTKLWKYNYVTALQLAEKNGGLDWRSKKTLSGIKLTLANSGTNILVWTVEYDSTDNSNLTVTLDANSGKVITN
jgi:hypothetical protein